MALVGKAGHEITNERFRYSRLKVATCVAQAHVKMSM